MSQSELFEEVEGVADFEKLIQDNQITLVDFGASWCGPCKEIYPKLLQLASNPSYQGVKYLKVDVDDGSEIVEDYPVEKLPTVVLYHKAKEVFRTKGASNQVLEDIKKELRGLLAKNQDNDF